MADQQKIETTMRMVQEPVGGWLLVLCLVLTFVVPATFLYGLFSHTVPRLLNTNRGSEKLLLTVYLTVFTQIALFGVAAGLQLWMVKPGAVAFARRFLWAYLIAHISYFVFWVLLMRPTQALSFAQMGYDHVAGAIAPFFLWFTYLEHSKRVQRTYAVP